MLLSAKPNKGWIRWNAVGSWTGLQTNYLTFVKGYSPPDGPNGVLYFNDDYRLHWYDDNEGDQTVATVEYMNSVMPAMAHDSAVAYKRPYKVYTAKLHQTGTNAPTATVFENSIGNISFNRPQLGQFSLACSGFDSTKTVVLLKENSLDPGGSYVLNWSFTSLSSFIINGYQIDIASPAYEAVDAAIRNAYIEIRVYD